MLFSLHRDILAYVRESRDSHAGFFPCRQDQLFEDSVSLSSQLQCETLAWVKVALDVRSCPLCDPKALVGHTQDVLIRKWSTAIDINVDVGVSTPNMGLPEIVEACVARCKLLDTGEARGFQIGRGGNRHRGQRLHLYRLKQLFEVSLPKSTLIALIEESFEHCIEDKDLMERAEMLGATLCWISFQRKKKKRKMITAANVFIRTLPCQIFSLPQSPSLPSFHSSLVLLITTHAKIF